MRSSAVLKSAPSADLENNIPDNKPDKKGMVLRLERSSIHDGTGFRTVIFLKGCPLTCLWCSTPESQSIEVQHTETESYGQEMDVEELMKEVRKDSIFYFHSGGGLTLSGGEPLMQADFAAALLRQACREGYHTAIETSLSVPFANVEKALPYLDLVYADIKHIDPEKHREYCGMDGACIQDNIRRIDAEAKNLKLILRMPLIPGINDDEETLHGIGQFCATLQNMNCIQLLPYHRLGADTYRKMGLPYALAHVKTPGAEHMEKCRRIVQSYVGTACL